MLTAFCCVFVVCSSYSQYDAKLYKRLRTESANAKSDDQKLKALINLADYHIEQSEIKGFASSKDSAFALLAKARKLEQKSNATIESAKIDLLYSKMYEFDLDYKNGVDFADRAIRKLELKPDKAALARAHIVRFNSYRYAADPDAVIASAEAIVQTARKSSDEALIGEAFQNLAESYYSDQSNPKRVLAALDSALFHYKKSGKKDIQSLYSFYGMLYSRSGNHAKSLHYNLLAIDIIERYQIDHYYNMTIYLTAGNMYRGIGRYETAIHYFEKAFALLDRYDDARYRVILGRYAVDVWSKLGNRGKTQQYLHTIESAYAEIDEAYIDMALIALLEGYSRIGKWQSATPYVTRALGILDRRDAHKIANFGALSIALGNYYFACKQYPQARKRLQDGIDFLSVTPIKSRLYEPYYTLFRIDSITGNETSAMRNLSIASTRKDSFFDIAKSYHVAELETRYGVQKRNNDNLLLKKQGELQAARLSKSEFTRNVSLIGILLSIMIVVVVYRKFRINHRLRTLLADQNLQLEDTLSDKDHLLKEREWLLKEVHHRVKNNLQIVMSLLNSQSHYLKDESAKSAIENSQHRVHTMSLIHKKLYQAESVATIDMANYFCELTDYYKVAFDTGGKVVFRLDAQSIELPASQAVPIGLILNEAVNNALKHAFPNGRNGTVDISLKRVDGHCVELRVSDDGIGFSSDVNEKPATLGMKLI